MTYEFASPEWFALLHGMISERVARESKTRPNLTMSACEVFYAAPPHLAGADGKLAWSCVVNGADVDFQRRERDDVQFKVVADYTTVVPLGRYCTDGDPARVAELTAMVEAATASGKFERIGSRAATGDALGSFHDVLAKLTA